MLKRIAGAAFALVATFGAVADEGRIPIYQPITITQSGSYVLTRNLTIPTGYFITIVGNLAVSIDFAGHTISGSADAKVIYVERGAGGTPCGSLRIRNGCISSATPVLWSTPAQCSWDFVIEGMSFDYASLEAMDGGISVTSSRFHNSSIAASGDRAPGLVRIEDNLIYHGNITLVDELGAQIRHNSITGGSIHYRYSATSGSMDRFIIDGNTADSISIGSDTAGGPATGVIVTGNTVSSGVSLIGCMGFRMADNVVHGNGATSGIILNWSKYGLIEGNRVWGATYGLEFDDMSSDNVFRNNVLRNNTSGPVLDNGTGNTDAGGNVN